MKVFNLLSIFSIFMTFVQIKYSYAGELRRMKGWSRVFQGDLLSKLDRDISQLRLTLVVSYCREDMTWMNEHFEDLGIKNVTIMSKCNGSMRGFNPAGAKIERLPNVGRCDHSWASWMAKMKEEDATDNHIVLFMKASRFLYQPGMRYRPIQDVIRIAVEHGFSCEAKPTNKSIYHRTALLRKFLIANHRGEDVKSQYENLGAWVDELGIKLPSPLTPVCYGGNFAVKATQIYAKKDVWSKMTESLSRGNSIEEGHFAERVWAGILSYPLTPEEAVVMSSISIRDGRWGPYAGRVELNE